jgi:hypothetical protein
MTHKPNRVQLIECYNCVFENTHSDSFKEAEMKDLLFNKDYWFLNRPKEGWEQALRNKLNEMGFDLDILKPKNFKG